MHNSIWKIETNNEFFEALTDYQLKQRFGFYIHGTSSIILLLQVSNLDTYSLKYSILYQQQYFHPQKS